MKSVIVSAVAALSLAGACAGARAASPDELGQIREQLQQLLQRVDRLEQENSALESENATLKARQEDLESQTRGLREDTAERAMRVANVEGADWTRRIALGGDLRYRHEQISDEALNAAGVHSTADRYRDRVRARFNARIEASDEILVGIGFATTEGGDPRSSNQSLGELFSRKALDLDTAYFDWRFAQWGHLIGGKMKQPFVKPGQSLFWDNDVNPEGLALTLASGPLFASAYGYWIDEASGPQSAVTADTMLFGGQVGVRLPIGASKVLLAAHYYDLAAGQGRAPFFAGNPNGNTTRGPGTPVLAYDYRVVNLSAELDATVAGVPLQVWADVARNQAAADLDTAWSTGVLFGKASQPRTWELGAAYQVLEKDALYAQLIDSDFAGGVSDAQGWVLRGGYAPVENWSVNATWFLNERNRDVPDSAGARKVDYERLQVDFNLKF